MIVILIVFIGLVLWIVKLLFTQTNSLQTETALKILRKRYTKGEIDRIEFEQYKNDLLEINRTKT